ncbi:MAG: asparagine synthase (glutamine-hydrolyzing), partial [Dehalococcoidia bacterium]
RQLRMSGIVGIFNLDGRPVDEVSLHGMLAAVAHRGPDESGIWVEGSVGLGHCQLRTTPESLNEHQPVSIADGRYVMVSDGRVDNREELIDALQSRAPVTDQTPDADLILHSYILWGAECLQRIVGDFAFVIWDQQKHQLFCARDPMGIKTFYYFQDERRFILASDIAAILTNPGVPQQLDQLKVGLILLGNLSEAEHTLFQGISQILPASALTVTRRGVTKEMFWEPDPWKTIKYATEQDYIDHFREVFDTAIKCRLRSLGSTGISLSGGMDSTSIACTAAQMIQQGQAPGASLESFSSVFKEFSKVDESRYIQQVLESWDIKAHLICGDDFWGFKPMRESAMLWNYPYPLSFHARHEALLTTARNAGVRVMLTGEGGDELLIPGIGYQMDLLRSLRLSRLRQELSYLDQRSCRYFWMEAVRFHLAGVRDLMPQPLQQIYRKLRPGTFDPWLNEKTLHRSGALQHRPMELSDPQTRSVYHLSQYVGPIAVSRSPFVWYITEMDARYQIEARHPFLDRRVVDFLTRVPPNLKVSGVWAKYLLRQSMQGILPDEVRLRRSKSDFGDITESGFHKEETRLRGLLERGFLVQAGWIKRSEIKDLYDRVAGGERAASHHLTPLVVLEEWLHQHFTSNGSGTHTGSLYSPISI